MNRTLSAGVVVALLAAAMPAAAQRGTERPLAEAALREAAALSVSGGLEQPQNRLPESVAAVAAAARRLPAGTKVTVKTVGGAKVKGTLLAAGDTSLSIERGQAAVELPYDTILSVESGGGLGKWKWAVIAGAAVGGLYIVGNCMAAADSGGHKTWCQ